MKRGLLLVLLGWRFVCGFTAEQGGGSVNRAVNFGCSITRAEDRT